MTVAAQDTNRSWKACVDDPAIVVGTSAIGSAAFNGSVKVHVVNRQLSRPLAFRALPAIVVEYLRAKFRAVFATIFNIFVAAGKTAHAIAVSFPAAMNTKTKPRPSKVPFDIAESIAFTVESQSLLSVFVRHALIIPSTPRIGT